MAAGVRVTAALTACALASGAFAAAWPDVRHVRVAFPPGKVRGQVTLLGRGRDEGEGAAPEDPTDAVVYLEPVTPAPGATRASAAALREAAIAMRGREFVPHVRVVLAGGEVAFPNDDPFSHNVFSNAEGNAFDLGLYRSHVSRGVRFAHPGVYPIYCNIHHRMVSFVVAVPAPYATAVGRDGRFAIADVPAGARVLHAWHERARETTRSLTVGGEEDAGDLRIVLDARGEHVGDGGIVAALPGERGVHERPHTGPRLRGGRTVGGHAGGDTTAEATGDAAGARGAER